MSTFPANRALELLRGESQGFAIDATTEGGSIAVKDTTTRANNHIISGVTTDFRNGLDSANNVRAGAVKLINSGTSPKLTHYDASPYVRWSPHNFISYSQDASGVSTPGWSNPTNMTRTDNATTAPDGTSTADQFVETTANAQHYTDNFIASGLVSGFVYTTSVYLKPIGAGRWIELQTGTSGSAGVVWFDILNGVVGTVSVGSGTITSAGSGWYRCVITWTAGSTTQNTFIQPTTADGSGGTYVGNTSNGFYIWGLQTVRGVNANPYLATTSAQRIGIPQSYDAVAEQYGILVEPASTNLTTYSQQLDQWQVGWGANPTADTVTAPDGTTTGDTLTASSGGTHHAVYSPATMGGGASSDVTCTYSWYLKQGTARYAVLSSTQDGTNWYAAIFDLQDGAVTQTGDGASGTYQSSSISSVGNGWYRCSVTGNHSGGNSYPFVGISNAATPSFANYGLVSFSAAGTETIYTWGMQYENGTVATSYIPTLGSTVTRAADDIKVLTSTLPSFTAHSAVANMKILASASAAIFQVGDATTNRDNEWYLGGSDFIQYATASGGSGSTQANFIIGTFTAGTAAKFGSRWNTNSFEGAKNGTLSGAADTSGSLMDGATTINIGRNGYSTSNTSFQYQLTFFPRALTDAELQAKTA